MPVFPGICLHIQHPGIHINLILLNVAIAAADRIYLVLLLLHNGFEYFMEPVQGHVPDQLPVIHRLPVRGNFFRKILPPVQVPGRIHLPVPQFQRHELVHLIFQQLLHQFLSGVFLLPLLVYFLGQQHSAFDVDKRGRHDQKLAHHIHVTLFHLPDVIQILLCDLHNGNIIDIYLVLINQM